MSAAKVHALAARTLSLLEAGGYTTPSGKSVRIAEWQRRTVEDTRLYAPDRLTALRTSASGERGDPAAVFVTDETTQEAAQRLVTKGVGNLVLLNFASARNPGGGFLSGAKAQEEDLCRCSGLYPALVTQPAYYRANRAQSSLLYTDHMIYSPRVPFFRVRGNGELLEEPFRVSVITAPAPNAGPLLERDPGAGPSIEATFERRWRDVLSIAFQEGHRNVLLGAWGCGAFRNDPDVAAETVARALEDCSHRFERVIFAIPGQGNRSRLNLKAFRARLER